MSNYLINKQAVRRIALIMANEKFSDSSLPDVLTDSSGREWNWSNVKKVKPYRKYRQVSVNFIENINAEVRNIIKSKIDGLDGKGSTVK